MAATNFNLRSSTSLDPYASLEFTAEAVFTAGQMYQLNDTVGVIVGTIAIGAQAVLVYLAAKIIVPCAIVTSGNLADYAVGSIVYFSVAGAEVTSVAGANVQCGRVLVTPAIGDETIEIHLQGNEATSTS